MKTKQRSLTITRSIHWSMAILVIPLATLGFYMANTQSYELYSLHKSFGVIALVLIIFRLFWRTLNPWQSSTKGTKTGKLVKRAHIILLLLLMAMPITGFLLSGLGGHGVSVFGLPIIPTQHDSQGLAIPFNKTLSDFGYLAHEVIAYLFSAMVILHIFAALKHHLIDKDNTLKRMLGSED